MVNIRPVPHLHSFRPAHIEIVCYTQSQLSEYGALDKHLQNQPEYLPKMLIRQA